MNIAFSPCRSDTVLSVVKSGDTLTINGAAFDFSAVGDGDVLPRDAVATDWLASDVTRSGGVLALTLVLPCPANAPAAMTNPVPITAADGPVPLPAPE